MHSLQPIDYKPRIIIDLISVSRLKFPHDIPLFKKEFTGPSRTFLEVTVRSSRGVHPPSVGGATSRTDESTGIACTSNLVRVQAITA